MSAEYQQQTAELTRNPQCWLVTGVAGFIGSNILETLLELDQEVVGLDNFTTGYQQNLDDVKRVVSPERWQRFRFVEGDICDLELCRSLCKDVAHVLHQAALGSVPRSIDDPVATNRANVDGFLTILTAAKEAGIGRVVYASSSSIYGDEPTLPKVEDRIGTPLSPYAVSKWVDEIYAANFAQVYGIETIGLRYFNVFGPRQDPNGAYAAVIPKWIQLLLEHKRCTINGDGESSRDFCFVSNAVQANLLAALTKRDGAINRNYNVAVGEQTSLVELYRLIVEALGNATNTEIDLAPEFAAFRDGDVRHSLADVTAARELLGFEPDVRVSDGILETVRWFQAR